MTPKLQRLKDKAEAAKKAYTAAICEEFPNGCRLHAFLNSNQKNTSEGIAVTADWHPSIRIRLPGETRRGSWRTKPVEIENCFHQPMTRTSYHDQPTPQT